VRATRTGGTQAGRQAAGGSPPANAVSIDVHDLLQVWGCGWDRHSRALEQTREVIGGRSMRFTSFADSIGWNIVAQPDAPALIWHDKQLTYSEFGTMTQNAADALHELRLAEHVPVSIIDKKSPQFIALIFACLAEHHPFPLPPATSFRPSHDGTPCAVMAQQPVTQPIRAGNEASALDRFTAWSSECFHIAPEKAVLNYTSLNFDLCFLDVWTSLAHGACVVLVDQDQATRHHADHRVNLDVQYQPPAQRALFMEKKSAGRWRL
jgi:non-ribosomal peptide synthetase component F